MILVNPMAKGLTKTKNVCVVSYLFSWTPKSITPFTQITQITTCPLTKAHCIKPKYYSLTNNANPHICTKILLTYNNANPHICKSSARIQAQPRPLQNTKPNNPNMNFNIIGIYNTCITSMKQKSSLQIH